MLDSHFNYQLEVAQRRQAEFLENARANALARELRPRRSSVLDGIAKAIARRLQRRRVPTARTSQA